MATTSGSCTGGARIAALLAVLALALVATCCLEASAELGEFVPRRLVDMSSKELEETISMFQDAEAGLSKREQSVMGQLGRSLPDGRQKNELRVMAMRHLNNYDALRKLKAELDKRAQAAEAGHQPDAAPAPLE